MGYDFFTKQKTRKQKTKNTFMLSRHQPNAVFYNEFLRFFYSKQMHLWGPFWLHFGASCPSFLQWISKILEVSFLNPKNPSLPNSPNSPSSPSSPSSPVPRRQFEDGGPRQTTNDKRGPPQFTEKNVQLFDSKAVRKHMGHCAECHDEIRCRKA